MKPSGSQIVPRRGQDSAKRAPRWAQDGHGMDFTYEKQIFSNMTGILPMKKQVYGSSKQQKANKSIFRARKGESARRLGANTFLKRHSLSGETLASHLKSKKCS